MADTSIHILQNEFIYYITNLRVNYEQQTGIKLDQSKQPYAISCFFGATDITKRDNYISFIEEIAALVLPQILPYPLDLTKEITKIQLEKHIEGLRILVMATLFIKNKIAKAYIVRSIDNADLTQLINEALALSPINKLNEETWKYILFSTSQFCTNTESLTIDKEKTKKEKVKKLQRYFDEFKSFVQNKSKEIEASKSYFPVSECLANTLAFPFMLTGNALGTICGKAISNSHSLNATRTALTASLITGGMYFGSGAVGLAIVAPSYAAQLLENFCGVSISWLIASTMQILGKGLGYGLGMPVDLFYKACFTLYHLYSDTIAIPPITGFSLANGQYYQQGVPLNLLVTKDDITTLEDTNICSPMLVSLEEIDGKLIIHFGKETAQLDFDVQQSSEFATLFLKLQKMIEQQQIQQKKALEIADPSPEQPDLSHLSQYALEMG